jgi:UDP-N-acetyl-D-mannosaminuronate dehydrogenase
MPRWSILISILPKDLPPNALKESFANLEVITKKKKLKLKSKKINKQNIIKYDLSIILTNHSYIDWEIVKKFSKKIFDTRNVFKEDNNKIILL